MTTSQSASQRRVRPSGWWYVLVPILVFAGLGVGIVGGIDEGRAVADSFASLGADGRGTTDLEAGDEATVMAFWNDGRSTDGIDRPPATVVVSGPHGDPVEFDQAGSGEMTFSFDSRSGIDLGTFTAGEAGEYGVSVTFDTPSGAVGTPLAAVGRLDFGSIIRRVVRPIGLGVAAAVGVWILLLVLRGSSKRRARSEPQVRAASPQSPSSSSGPFV